jgi:O-antigen/teichoic acid export membrane protein
LSSLKNKSIKALAWDFLGTFSTQGVTFIISIFLARILSPEDFGIIGMSLVFIGISEIFTDVGFTSALIQAKENKSISYSSVFWLNLFLSFCIFLLFQLLAPIIASFYEEPIIERLVRLLAWGIPLGALNKVQTARLKRDLKFKELSLRTFLAGVISGIIGLVAAFQDYGVYALVAQTLSAAVITTIVLWKVSDWRPKFEFSKFELSKLFNFSKYVFFGQMLGQVISKLDTLVIGKVFSAATLGFFSRAQSLNALVVRYSSRIINNVFFPVLSKLQDDLKRFSEVYLRVVTLTSFVSFFLSGILILAGEALIITLFGEKWAPSVFIFNILMLRLFNYPINAIIISSFLALGKSKENFWHGNIRKVMRLLTIVVAIFFEFNWFLYSLVIVSYIVTIYNNVIISRAIKAGFWRQIVSIYKFGLLFFALLAVLCLFLPRTENLILNAIISCTLFSLSYLSLSLLLDKKLFTEIKQLLQKRKSPTPIIQ